MILFIDTHVFLTIFVRTSVFPYNTLIVSLTVFYPGKNLCILDWIKHSKANTDSALDPYTSHCYEADVGYQILSVYCCLSISDHSHTKCLGAYRPPMYRLV